MPISPKQSKKYPGGSHRSKLWNDIRGWVGTRSGWKCEGSPTFPDCRAKHGKPHPVTGSKVVLTVAHMEHRLDNNGPGDLRHLCQLCHNTHDAPHRAKNRRIKKSRDRRRHIIEMKKKLA